MAAGKDYSATPLSHAHESVTRPRPTARLAHSLKRLADGDEIDLLFCHDPRTLEQGAEARGLFAALTAKLRPALVLYAYQHRPHMSVAGEPALIGLGSFRN